MQPGSRTSEEEVTHYEWRHVTLDYRRDQNP